MKTFLSWKSAGEMLKRRAKKQNLETVSFSFFNCMAVLNVHRQAARQQTMKTLAERLGLHEENTRSTLESAWNLASAIYVSKGLDWEPPVRVVFDRWIRLLSGHIQTDQEIAALVDNLIDGEIEFLATHTTPNAALVQAVQNMKTNGTRIMIIEDTSFSASDLQRISQRTGAADLIDTWITSADKGFRKQTGKLFKKLDQTPDLHIGTDPSSDGIRAAEAHIEPWIAYDLKSNYYRHQKGLDHIWWPLESAGFTPSKRTATNAIARTLHKHPDLEFIKIKIRTLIGK